MNIQNCARCGFVVYPAEKISCINQNWHKACFHCEVCKMVLTANNFVSHQKRPYCQVHNPRNNSFTSVYETPININAKKQAQAVSEIKYREEGERFMSTFHYDMRSRELEQARKVSHVTNQNQQAEFAEQQSWYSGSVTSQEIIRVTQAQKTISDVKYTEDYEQSKGKGSFPAMITPAYEQAKRASTLASNFEYKKGHEERVSKYTTVTDTPEVVLAKNQGKITSDHVYTEEYEQQRGKGSFPAHFTPGYQVAKKANEMASKVKYQQKYEQELKGKASAEAGLKELLSQVRCSEGLACGADTEECEEQRGKGSFPAMITPGYQLAKKAQDIASDLKYKKDVRKMKGLSHYHTLCPDDNLALKNARKINKLVSEVEYKKDLENTKGHSINYCETPQFKNTSKIAQFTSDNKYKEKYTNHMKGHYEGTGIDKKTLHAMKVRKLASNIAYKSEYEQEKSEHCEYHYPATITPSYQTQRKLEPLRDVNYRQHIDKVKFSSVTETPDIVQARINAQQLSDLNYKANYEKMKTQYTLSQDLPELRKAKANAELISDIKYKEEWEKSKSKPCDVGLDTLTVKAAKASRELASDIKYKESYMKEKDKAVGVNVSDSKTLHSLQVAKLSSEIAYKKGSKETQSKCTLPLDMVNLSHAKKAQALASDLEYRKKLHDYTVLPDDIKVQHAKKAYNLQSESQYRSDLTWMKGVGWEAEGCLDVTQAKKAGELLSEKKYRQKVDTMKFTQVADTPSIKHAKRSQELQSGVAYKAGTEQTMHQYTISKDEPLFKQAKANAELLSEKTYKSSLEQQREKGFELRMDALSILTAKAKRDLASDVKYKEKYEMMKGKMIGVKTVTDDSQMAHSTLATKLQSDLQYKKDYENTKTRYSASLDMLTLTHAKKAQDLATDKKYRTVQHKYTSLPTDMRVEWAKKAYGLQSDKKYRSDLNWMKGVGWEGTGSLGALQAKKAGDIVSEKKYRQQASSLKFTSVEDTPEMVQAKLSNQLALDRLYREKGEGLKHSYTLTGDLPEYVQSKLNAMNLSETHYKESWMKIRDAGYKLRLDAIPFQAAKSSAEILSDQKYKEQFEKTKGKMIGLKGLQDDINIAHSVQASQLQSDIKYKKDLAKVHSELHVPMDMLELAHAKKAQTLVSDQDYRLALHHYTTLPDDLKVQAARRAYELQSEKLYRSDLNYLRGVAWIGTGSVQIEGSKRATDLVSEKKYRQQPHSFKHTSVTDSPDIVHAKLSSRITNERLYKEAGASSRHNYTITVERPEITQAKINAANFSDIKYKESWHTLRAQGYKLTMQDIPFQTAKTSTDIASDYQYKHSHLLEKGKHIGVRSVLDDRRLTHCLQMGRLQSDQQYRKDAMSISGQYHLPLDMVNLSHAKKAQSLVSDQDYKKKLHEYTILPDDMKVQWAKKAYNLQSEKLYKSDMNFMKGVAWDSVGAPQLEWAKKAGELLSDKKYRQLPDSLKFTQVADSPDIIHAKNSYMQCSERLYKSGDSDAMHRYTLPLDHPDFIRAKTNALHISDKVYKSSGEQVRSAGYDLRLDAIPFQTAKASRDIASDFRYKEAFVKGKGQQVGLLSADDDPKIRHSLAVGKLQSDNLYKRQFEETRSQFKMYADQPQFLHAKKSQAQASNLSYRQRLHDYTCDPEQLNVKHAKQAYKLQSDVNYKSDLNWIRGVGWTPPGSHKVEMARRAAELGLADGVDTEEAIAQYQQMMMLQREQQMQGQESSSDHKETREEVQQPGVNPDAMEILQVKRKKTIHTTFKQAKTTKSMITQSTVSRSTTNQSITNQSTAHQSITSQSSANESKTM
ncbi:nebulin-related-anchoring protein isoform X2 [Chanos chanos]|uniref:Nebulin-related-anchoring protein isoform X2 n=1 Tax=Chanos chanos TaxID=29144 RepID=A0A6J2VB38_CHACN|nr:nebulin-related-anchoring protein isoform X2 [Chanos chanos]